jgi:hypothetical protein
MGFDQSLFARKFVSPRAKHTWHAAKMISDVTVFTGMGSPNAAPELQPPLQDSSTAKDWRGGC